MNMAAANMDTEFSVYIFIKPDIMQTPLAPQSSISSIWRQSNLIPPMAYTGRLVSLHMFRRKSSPLGLSPFLQSVSYMCPAVT